jgi:hypothetical protein
MSGFQSQVNLTPAPAVAGDFASANPRASVLAGPGGLVAGEGGVTVGKFAWVATDGTTTYNYGTSPNVPAGFVHRDMQALIQTYLAEASNNVPEGFGVTLFSEGDFWAVNNGPSASVMNDQVYARFSDGAVFAASAPDGATATGAMGSTSTAALGATFTATGTGTSFAVTAVTGLISIGDEISGTGVTAGTTIDAQVSGTTGGAGTYTTSAATTSSGDTVTSFGSVVKTTSTTGFISIGETISGGAGFPVGATIVSQVSGTTGGAGVYTISAPGTAYTASATGVTTFGNVLNISAVGAGVLAVGDPVTGTGVPASSVIASQVSGTTGAAGIYTLSNSATAYAASTAITATGGVSVTGWKIKSVGAVGELVKISTWG